MLWKAASCSPARAHMNEQPQARSTWPTTARAPPLGWPSSRWGRRARKACGAIAVALAERLVGEVVQPGRAGAVAGEVEGDQPVQVGVVGHVVGREVEVGRDRLVASGAGRASPGRAAPPGGAAGAGRRWGSPCRGWR